MVKKTIILLSITMCCAQITLAKTNRKSGKISVQQYISKWNNVAKNHMLLFRIPASIILAQGILESGYGNSKMAQMANNHFGIKSIGWKGAEYKQTNSENGYYRKYTQTEDSYRDHARIIASKDRYAFLFKLNISDYKAWATGLKKAGYAEDPQYANLLIKTIENYDLHQYDDVASNGLALTNTSPKLEFPAESTGVTNTFKPVDNLDVVKFQEKILPIEGKSLENIKNDQEYVNALIALDVEAQIQTALAFGIMPASATIKD